MLSEGERRQISKWMSLVLRHNPQKAGLTLGAEGFTPLADLLAAMRKQRGWAERTEADIREVVTTSDKQRFEIVGNQIRARYGHSVEEAITYPPVTPPEILYHGTSPDVLDAIRREGLKPMRRQYVHLSSEVSQAEAVGRRHHPRPVILTVAAARAAAESDAEFYCPEPRLYLSTAISPEFIIED